MRNRDDTKCQQREELISQTLPVGMKMVQPPGKYFGSFFKKRRKKLGVPYDPAIVLLAIYPREVKTHVHPKLYPQQLYL